MRDYLDMQRSKVLLGFHFMPEPGHWIATAVGLFRPEGLLVAHAPQNARLASLIIGNRIVLPWGDHPIDLAVLERIEMIEAQSGKPFPGRPSYGVAEPGDLIKIRIVDLDDNPLGAPLGVTLWGTTVH